MFENILHIHIFYICYCVIVGYGCEGMVKYVKDMG